MVVKTKPVAKAKPKAAQPDFELVSVIHEGVGTRIIAYTSIYQDKPFFNIRKQYRKKGEEEWSMTRDGIAVPMEDKVEGRKQLVRMAKAAKAAALLLFGE